MFIAVRREDFRDFHDDDLSLATQFISRYAMILLFLHIMILFIQLFNFFLALYLALTYRKINFHNNTKIVVLFTQVPIAIFLKKPTSIRYLHGPSPIIYRFQWRNRGPADSELRMAMDKIDLSLYNLIKVYDTSIPFFQRMNIRQNTVGIEKFVITISKSKVNSKARKIVKKGHFEKKSITGLFGAILKRTIIGGILEVIGNLTQGSEKPSAGTADCMQSKKCINNLRQFYTILKSGMDQLRQKKKAQLVYKIYFNVRVSSFGLLLRHSSHTYMQNAQALFSKQRDIKKMVIKWVTLCCTVDIE
ncbi:hypothetical protein AGLY_002686 [Aphis glycines]|uniref:Uncharacterized protein n=1 Tax=Aphis glycines TaxID=307491 RepID=A0A6G0U101_APHGL|nr:hypothetical protein AGLY_002686 [Aphis glycines]